MMTDFQQQSPSTEMQSLAPSRLGTAPDIITDPRVRMNPAIMSFVMQCAQTAQLVKLNKHMADSMPPSASGMFEQLNIAISPALREIKMSDALMSISLHNYGAGNARFYFNSTGSAHMTLSVGETINLNLGKKSIERIFLETDEGDTAVVDVKGQY